MRTPLLAILLLLATYGTGKAEQENDPPATVSPVGQVCKPGTARPCTGRDALIFIHGIFGDSKTTFKNGSYDWPRELSKVFPDIDIYMVEYRTKLISWLKRDVATFDSIAETLFFALQGNPSADRLRGLMPTKGYRSVGFIAHSLGGNVAAAYIHSIKSELGHEERARNAYLITLGTPAHGAQIANLGLFIKEYLGMPDPLLKALEHDNTFLRMLAAWRRAEARKGQRFNCRPSNLYVGVEGGTLAGIRIVSEASAKEPYQGIAKDIQVFGQYNHTRIAAPDSANDPLNIWVIGIIKAERERLDRWGQQRVCRQSS